MRYFSTARYIPTSGIILGVLIVRLDSGHGGQIPDKDGDETDGLDEGTSYSSLFRTSLTCARTVIYPVDYKKAGLIVDDVRSFVFNLPWLITSNAGHEPHYGTLVSQ